MVRRAIFNDETGEVEFIDDGRDLVGEPVKTRAQAKAAGVPRSTVAAGRTGQPQPLKPKAAPAPTKGKLDAGQKALRAEMNARPDWMTGASGVVAKALPWAPIAAGLIKKMGNLDIADYGRRATSGFAAGVDSRIRALQNTAQDVGRGQGIKEAYNENRTAERQANASLAGRTGVGGDIAEFTGALVNPLGTKGAGKAVGLVQKAREAKAVGKAAKLGIAAQGALTGAATGAKVGALDAAARSEDWTDPVNLAGNTIKGAGSGAIFGGTLGGIAPTIGDIGTAAANKFLRPGKQGTFAQGRRVVESGEEALGRELGGAGVRGQEARLGEMTAEGANPILADVSSQAQARMRALTDQGTRGTDTLAGKLLKRASERGGRVRAKLEGLTGADSAVTSKAQQAAMREGRLAGGKVDYAPGGVMDQPVTLTPQQTKALKARIGPTKAADKEFRDMYNKARETMRGDPDLPPMKKGDPATFRTMDFMLRHYRDSITELYKAGKGTEASIMRKRFDALRETLRTANPKYADVIDNQARGLAQEEAAKHGDILAGKIFSNPREVADFLQHGQSGKGLHIDDEQAIRSALVDKMFKDTGGKGANSLMEKIRTALSDPNQPEQKAVMSWILGGTKQADDAMKLIKAEQQGVKTEARLGGSQTSTNIAGAERAEEDTLVALANMARGAAGAASGSPGMTMNAILQSFYHGGRAAKGLRKEAVNRVQLARLRRDAKPGDVEKLMTRVEAAKARQGKRAIKAGRNAGRSIRQLPPIFNDAPRTED